MKGTICCNRCSQPMPQSGVCPECQTARCHIEIYYNENLYKFYRNKKRILYGFDSAFDDLIAINRLISEGKFNPHDWITGKLQERLMRNVLHLWLAEKEREVSDGDMSPGGVAPYRSFIKQHFIPFLGDYDIKDVDKHVIKQFYAELKKKGIKHKTQKNIIDGLHAFFGWAVDSAEDYIESVPPFPTVKVKDATPQQAIDEESQTAGIARIPERHRDPFIVEADMCLRPGEVVAFKVKDFIQGQRGIWVQRTESKSTIKENTKADKKVFMLLTDESLAIVNAHAHNRFGDDFLFVNPDTQRRYTVNMLGVIWKKFSETNVKHYEGMRHSSLTHLAKTGDAYLVRDAGRHSDIRTSQKYVHKSQERLRSAMNNRKKVVDIKSHTGNGGEK